MADNMNIKLQSWDNRVPNKFAGKGNIEKAGQYENIIWQNRSYPPTTFQMTLSETLQDAYEKTHGTLTELVNYLNQVGVYDESGNIWSEEGLKSYILRVGD